SSPEPFENFENRPRQASTKDTVPGIRGKRRDRSLTLLILSFSRIHRANRLKNARLAFLSNRLSVLRVPGVLRGESHPRSLLRRRLCLLDRKVDQSLAAEESGPIVVPLPLGNDQCHRVLRTRGPVTRNELGGVRLERHNLVLIAVDQERR